MAEDGFGFLYHGRRRRTGRRGRRSGGWIVGAAEKGSDQNHPQYEDQFHSESNSISFVFGFSEAIRDGTRFESAHRNC